jgi:hypothetical protein
VSDIETMRKWTLIAIQETNKPDRLAESTEHTIESLETRDEKDLLEEPNEVTAVDASSSEVSARSHNLELWQWQMEFEILALYGIVTGGLSGAHARWGWGELPDVTRTVQGAMTTEDFLVMMLMASYALYHMAWWVAQRRMRAELRTARDNVMV